jgi:hypothetical protein
MEMIQNRCTAAQLLKYWLYTVKSLSKSLQNAWKREFVVPMAHSKHMLSLYPQAENELSEVIKGLKHLHSGERNGYLAQIRRLTLKSPEGRGQ